MMTMASRPIVEAADDESGGKRVSPFLTTIFEQMHENLHMEIMLSLTVSPKDK